MDHLYHLYHAYIVCLDSFGLFCYRNKWIYQSFQHIVHCLSVHLYLVGLIALLNVIYVQRDNCSQFWYIGCHESINFINLHGNFNNLNYFTLATKVFLVWVSLATRGLFP